MNFKMGDAMIKSGKIVNSMLQEKVIRVQVIILRSLKLILLEQIHTLLFLQEIILRPNITMVGLV